MIDLFCGGLWVTVGMKNWLYEFYLAYPSHDQLFNLYTLKCLSYFSLPFVHKGVHLDPTILSTFHLHHICIHPKQP